MAARAPRQLETANSAGRDKVKETFEGEVKVETLTACWMMTATLRLESKSPSHAGHTRATQYNTFATVSRSLPDSVSMWSMSNKIPMPPACENHVQSWLGAKAENHTMRT
eukprot:1010846-Prorocentrum_minimum.AAC.7